MVIHEVKLLVTHNTCHSECKVCFDEVLALRRRVYPLQSCLVTNVKKENSLCCVDLDVVKLLYEILIF